MTLKLVKMAQELTVRYGSSRGGARRMPKSKPCARRHVTFQIVNLREGLLQPSPLRHRRDRLRPVSTRRTDVDDSNVGPAINNSPSPASVVAHEMRMEKAKAARPPYLRPTELGETTIFAALDCWHAGHSNVRCLLGPRA